jgi:hypothetical protein
VGEGESGGRGDGGTEGLRDGGIWRDRGMELLRESKEYHTKLIFRTEE